MTCVVRRCSQQPPPPDLPALRAKMPPQLSEEARQGLEAELLAASSTASCRKEPNSIATSTAAARAAAQAAARNIAPGAAEAAEEALLRAATDGTAAATVLRDFKALEERSPSSDQVRLRGMPRVERCLLYMA